VADLSVMEAEVLVDETDIHNVKLGQAAEVRVDALEGVTLKGRVTEIGASAIARGAATGAASTQAASSTGNQAKDFRVTVTLEDPPPGLRPGLNATAEILVARKEDVLAAPIQAVVVRELGPEGKVVDPAALQAAEGEPATPRRKGEEREGVFVLRDGKAVFTPVQTGIVGETDIEIASGLQAGDEIVSGSYKTLRTLKDQARVRLEKEKETP
jgi:HlyD family secretion protein